jgi:hypothetical protein
MKKLFLIKIAFALLAILAFSVEAKSVTSTKTTSCATVSVCTRSSCGLHQAMRVLWEDHVIYTHDYIVSSLAGWDDTDAIAQRLMQNQIDIGNAIKPYYGEDAGNKLTDLLKTHITLATQIVTAAKMNNSKDLSDAQVKWKQNANDIAIFLNGLNSDWSKKDLTKMLEKHLQLTSSEAINRLNKNWAEDVNSFDASKTHMLMFADYLSDSLVKQFPDKFIQ